MLPCHAQTLQILSEGRLCVGYPSGFSIYSILGDHHPICKYNIIGTNTCVLCIVA